jgi:hypothetical protein
MRLSAIKYLSKKNNLGENKQSTKAQSCNIRRCRKDEHKSYYDSEENIFDLLTRLSLKSKDIRYSQDNDCYAISLCSKHYDLFKTQIKDCDILGCENGTLTTLSSDKKEQLENPLTKAGYKTKNGNIRYYLADNNYGVRLCKKHEGIFS